MEPIGAKLKEARERKGMTLQEAKRELRIHGPYLEALEAGEFGKLPAPAYARAFLRQYAAFLGLDPQPLVDAYNAHAGNTPPALNVGWTAAPETRTGWGSWTATAVAGVVLGLALVGAYEVRSYLVGKEAVQRQAAMQSRQRTSAVPRKPMVRQPSGAPAVRPSVSASSSHGATGAIASRPAAPAAGNRPGDAAPSPAAAGTPPGNGTASAAAPAGAGQTPVSGGTSRPSAGQPTPESRPAPLAPGANGLGDVQPAQESADTPALAGVEGTPKGTSGPGVQVSVVAQERCWVKVRSGGRTIYSGSLMPGESRSWQGSEAVGLTLGNAGGVRVSVNGQDVGPLGRPGQVVHRVFRATASGSGT